MNVLRGSFLFSVFLCIHGTLFSMADVDQETLPVYATCIQEYVKEEIGTVGKPPRDEPELNYWQMQNEEDFDVHLGAQPSLGNDLVAIVPGSDLIIQNAAAAAMEAAPLPSMPDCPGVVSAEMFRLHPEMMTGLKSFAETVASDDFIDEKNFDRRSAAVCLALMAAANDAINMGNLLRPVQETAFYRTMEWMKGFSTVTTEIIRKESEKLLEFSDVQPATHCLEWHMLLSHFYRLPFESLMEESSTYADNSFVHCVKRMYGQINCSSKKPSKYAVKSVAYKKREKREESSSPKSNSSGKRRTSSSTSSNEESSKKKGKKVASVNAG